MTKPKPQPVYRLRINEPSNNRYFSIHTAHTTAPTAFAHLREALTPFDETAYGWVEILTFDSDNNHHWAILPSWTATNRGRKCPHG